MSEPVNPRRGPEAAEHPYAMSRAVLLGAFAAVVCAGLLGAAIGLGLVRVSCTGSCATPEGLGALIGGVVTAAGGSIVAILVLRALAEWKTGGVRRRELG